MISPEVVQNAFPKVLMAAGAIVLYNIISQLFRNIRTSRALSKYPFINEKWDAAAKAEFQVNADKLVQAGRELAKNSPFRLNDRSMPRLVLPTKYIEEIKNDDRLDFHSFVSKEFFASYPGFDGFSDSIDQKIFQDAVRIHLTQALALTIEPLAAEIPRTLDLLFGEAPEWKEAVLVPNLIRSISRATSLVFLGEDFMNSREWQTISVMYAVDAFIAATALNAWPAPLRPLVHWFLPECRKIRAEVKVAKNIISPVVEKRRAELDANGGKPRRKILDSVDWFVAAAKGKPFDYVSAQLSLAMASIHSTSNTVGFAMFDLITHPEYLGPLREEISSVFKATGKWEKNTLFQLKLLDSFLKESMRCHPHSVVTMPRVSKQDITLSDNVFIPKDTYMFIGPVPHQDPELYPDPTEFNGYRFYKMREEPGHANKHQFVSTGPEITVFGHGHHSCPGRFFASNEIKLLMVYMIMYYDWKLPEGVTTVEATKNGISRSPNSRQKVLYKSRIPEVDIRVLA